MDEATVPATARQVPDVLESTHAPTGDPAMLFTSFRVWVQWMCRNWGLPTAALFQQPVIVMELDTAWRAWGLAWGPNGSVDDKAAWFREFETVRWRVFGKPKPLIDVVMAAKSFWTVPDAPSGTLGALPVPTRAEVEECEAAVFYKPGERDRDV